MRKKTKLEDEKETEQEKFMRMTEEERGEMEATEYEHDKFWNKPKVQKVYKRKSHISLKKQVKNMSPEEKEQFLKKAWSEGQQKSKKKRDDDENE